MGSDNCCYTHRIRLYSCTSIKREKRVGKLSYLRLCERGLLVRSTVSVTAACCSRI